MLPSPTNKKSWITLWLLGNALAAFACPLDLPVVKSQIHGHVLELEVAKSEDERRCGLSGRHSMAADQGMLFVLPRRMRVQFWMKDMEFPLAIAFLNRDKKILDIQSMDVSQPERLYRSPEPIWYVVEVNRDWFEKHSVKVGDRFVF